MSVILPNTFPTLGSVIADSMVEGDWHQNDALVFGYPQELPERSHILPKPLPY